jgi:hypothetical protein
MSGGVTYVWEDSAHTAVFRYVDPPQPELIDIVGLQAEIDSLTAQADAIVLATEVEMLADIQANLDTVPTVAEHRAFTDDLCAQAEAEAGRKANLTARAAQFQTLLDTINAEATD